MPSHDKEIQKAFDLAKIWAARDGIHPSVDEYGEEHYRIQQALKAACHGREDITALVILQQSVLRRLGQLRVLAIIGLLLLAYIAERVS